MPSVATPSVSAAHTRTRGYAAGPWQVGDLAMLDPDTLYALICEEGPLAWRIPTRGESGGFSSRVAAHQYRTVLGILDNELAGKPASRVLDWGCGAAAHSYAIAHEGHLVWGMDFEEPPMAGYVAEHTEGRFTFTQSKHPTELPFDDAFFDVVLSNGCLEHVTETGGKDEDCMRELVRVLKPGGAFVCAHLPNEGSYIEAVARVLRGPVRKHLHYPLYAHVSLYSRARVEELAAGCGLSVTEFVTYGALPRNPLSLLPRQVSDASWFVDGVDRFDDWLATVLERYCQNFAWVGRALDHPR